ncbi:MAG: hypothetical protein KJ623_04755 [Nanoarchaeota archaeon]|nr:hypothetical protein [Nanoarchaeota archaeon]MBU0963340.1 hypothetical protein [Nanoarchaeota archaeon]
MISINEQKNLLVTLGNKLPKQITTYAIGGTAMMFLGFKESTKDIDLVFTSSEERNLFKKTAESFGYNEMDSVIVYGVKNNRPMMINLGNSRFDLFLMDVIDFTFSPSMQERAEQVHHFGKNLIIRIADKHDIILMKCATNRARDEEDIINIVKISDINWNILIEEAKKQVKLGRETAFLEMGELIEKLISKYKLNISKKIGDKFYTLLKEQAEKKKKNYDKKV